MREVRAAKPQGTSAKNENQNEYQGTGTKWCCFHTLSIRYVIVYIVSPFLLVSFAAVIRVVTQRSSPLTAVSGEERCVTSNDPNNGCEGD